MLIGWIAGLLVVAMLSTLAVVHISSGPWKARFDAWVAVRALNDGDLEAVEKRLIGHRGDREFAYHFASGATPRALGDALATAAGPSKEEPFAAGVDPHEFELTLTDLAGALALATHGTGDRALPESWTKDFVTATTKPSDLYEVEGSVWDKNPFTTTPAEERRNQDEANRSNLLLLLSRGYWSTDFLQAVTRSYYAWDRAEEDEAWPRADPGDELGYAPAPSGAYLTDGILALSAALTANPAASEWAFTEFQPEAARVAGTEYHISTFAHFLMFEHTFPEVGGEHLGTTAALTALSSAIDPLDVPDEASTGPGHVSPGHDSAVLQAVAQDVKHSRCSWNPSDYGHCVVAAAKALWTWVQRWGHVALDILSLAASFAPPPFYLISLASATVNATWYAVEGDYGSAGLSLAAVVPGLSFTKLAKGVRGKQAAGRAQKIKDAKAVGAAKASEQTAEVAQRWRLPKAWKDCNRLPPGGLRLNYKEGWSEAQRKEADAKVKAIFKAARRGELVKTKVERQSTSAAVRYRKHGGTIPEGKDVDHPHELQLGGVDDISNMQPIDKAVNRSLGAQISRQLKGVDYGTQITGIAIC